jgi:hypothetical protein
MAAHFHLWGMKILNALIIYLKKTGWITISVPLTHIVAFLSNIFDGFGK